MAGRQRRRPAAGAGGVFFEDQGDVFRAQEREFLRQQDPLLKHEKQGWHHEGHVLVPAGPAPHLIPAHAGCAPRSLESALDPKPGGRHPRGVQEENVRCGIAQDIFDFRGVPVRPPCDEVPALRHFLFAVPQPDAGVQKLPAQAAVGAVTALEGNPGVRALPRHPILHGDIAGGRLTALKSIIDRRDSAAGGLNPDTITMATNVSQSWWFFTLQPRRYILL